MPTREELLKRGAKPVTRKYTREELLKMGAKPVQTSTRVPNPPSKSNDGTVSGSFLGALNTAYKNAKEHPSYGPPVPPEIFARAKGEQVKNMVSQDYSTEVLKGAYEGGKQILGGLKRTITEPGLAGPLDILAGAGAVAGAPVSPVFKRVAQVSALAAGKTPQQGEEALSNSMSGLQTMFGDALVGASKKTRVMLGKPEESTDPLFATSQENLRTAGRGIIESGLALTLAGLPERGGPSAPKPSRMVRKRMEELGNVGKKNAPLRNFLEKEKARGHDPVTDIAAIDVLVDAVDKNGVISTKQPGGAVSQYQQAMGEIEGKITNALRKEGTKVPVKVVEDAMRREVEASGMKMASKAKALKAIDDEIAGLKLDADKYGYVDLTDVQLAKIDKYANVNYLNESGRVDKTFGRALKKVVEDNMKSLDAKEANAVIGRHKANLKFLELLDGRRVSGGQLGKYFATGVGAMVGAQLPLGPFGPMLGAELGNRMKGGVLSRVFGKMTGRNMELSPEEISALTPREVVQPKLLGAGPLRMGPKADTSGPIQSPIRPGFGMAGPEDYYRPMSKNLLPERAGESPITLPQSVRETNLGLDQTRGTVFGQSSSSNSLGSRQMAQTTNATNPIKPKNIIEGQVKPSTALGGSKGEVKLGALEKAKKAPTPEDALIQEARKYKSAELDRWRGDSFWGKTVTEKASEINVPLSEIGEGKTISLRQSQVTEKGVREWMDKIQSGERPAILVGNRPMGKGEITVLDGNHTLEAYRRLGFKEIPVIDIKSQLTDIWKKANTPEDALIQEARKYKSAEEFVKKTIGDFPDAEKRFVQKQLERPQAELRGIEMSRKREAKMMVEDLGRPLNKQEVEKLFAKYDKLEKPFRDRISELEDSVRGTDFLNTYRRGFKTKEDWVKHLKEIGLKEDGDIKSQLTDIWKKANQAR